eukprot:4046609-Amphidinium_carterae.1
MAVGVYTGGKIARWHRRRTHSPEAGDDLALVNLPVREGHRVTQEPLPKGLSAGAFPADFGRTPVLLAKLVVFVEKAALENTPPLDTAVWFDVAKYKVLRPQMPTFVMWLKSYVPGATVTSACSPSDKAFIAQIIFKGRTSRSLPSVPQPAKLSVVVSESHWGLVTAAIHELVHNGQQRQQTRLPAEEADEDAHDVCLWDEDDEEPDEADEEAEEPVFEFDTPVEVIEAERTKQ